LTAENKELRKKLELINPKMARCLFRQYFTTQLFHCKFSAWVCNLFWQKEISTKATHEMLVN